MIFNSIPFAIFLPIVFILYWFVANKNLRLQNILLLASSYFFYAYWDWRFLFLLVGLSLYNYVIGLLIQKENTHRKHLLISGILVNVGILSYFKYLNFFIDSFAILLNTIGFNIQTTTLNIVLPLGISFYVFLSLSYIIDIYQKKLKANNNIIDVLLSLSFFPIILAGPIQRPTTLLPQIIKKRIFDYSLASNGLRQILWGLFMKIVIADRCSINVIDAFGNYNCYEGSTLILGAILYTVQIYSDFAGYSHISIGVASLFGFKLMQNFAYPYFARDITIFWKRWHISLTTWFRDYVFLPISYSVSRKVRSDYVYFIRTDYFIYFVGIVITWALTGLWHGASYTFVVWGLFNGFFLLFYKFTFKSRKMILKKINLNSKNIYLLVCEWFFTMLIIIVSWIFFKAESVNGALTYISRMFSGSILSKPQLSNMGAAYVTVIFVVISLTIEWFYRNKNHVFMDLELKFNKPMRFLVYFITIFIIINYMNPNASPFLYFEF